VALTEKTVQRNVFACDLPACYARKDVDGTGEDNARNKAYEGGWRWGNSASTKPGALACGEVMLCPDHADLLPAVQIVFVMLGRADEQLKETLRYPPSIGTVQ
jgi:hypothetical protein